MGNRGTFWNCVWGADVEKSALITMQNWLAARRKEPSILGVLSGEDLYVLSVIQNRMVKRMGPR